MFCPNCGNQMNDDASFCANCGWKKEQKESKASLLSKITKKFIKPILAAFCVLLLGIIIYNASKPKGKVYEFGDIGKVKLATKYSKNSVVENFDSVKFGSYPQSDVSGNTKEPIEWIVLERQGDKALLLSKYIIDCKCYNDELKYVTWENCTLRNWLNMHFYNTAFSSSEQNKILTTNIVNSDNSDYGTNGGNNTNDKIFCLSIDEVKKYFNQDNMESKEKRLATKGTNYAKTIDNGGYTLYMNGGNSMYWLRSPGDFQDDAAGVDYVGYLDEDGLDVDFHRLGVRPALWVSY